MTSKLTYVALLTLVLLTGCSGGNSHSPNNVVEDNSNGMPANSASGSSDNSPENPTRNSDNSVPDNTPPADSNSGANNDGTNTKTSFNTFVIDLIQNQTEDDTDSVEVNDLEFLFPKEGSSDDDEKDNEDGNEDDNAFKSLLL